MTSFSVNNSRGWNYKVEGVYGIHVNPLLTLISPIYSNSTSRLTLSSQSRVYWKEIEGTRAIAGLSTTSVCPARIAQYPIQYNTPSHTRSNAQAAAKDPLDGCQQGQGQGQRRPDSLA